MSAALGSYLTPLRASGISATIMSALKMTADKMAELAVARCMMLSTLSAGKTAMNIAGMMAKYLATSLEMLKVVSAPRVIRSCLDRKSTRLNSSHLGISYAVFCLKKKNTRQCGGSASAQRGPAQARTDGLSAD